VASGVAWDLSGVPAAAFAPLAVCALGLMLLPVALLLKKELR
jgi:hypothetical protein